MKKIIKYFLFVALVVFMTACPFEAPFPLDEPGVKYAASIKGKWIESSEMKSDMPSYYMLTEKDSFTFNIEEFSYQEEEDAWSSTVYSAHLSNVGEYQFLNVFDPSMETWYFYRMDWDDADQFSLFAVTDYIDEKFANAAEMKNYFKKYADLSFFYQAANTYMRSSP